ncbi:MAG: homoserine kinase [Candidatus Dormibacteria bacterium]
MGDSRDQGLLVRVPASSANLGSAFDTAALALDLYLEVQCLQVPEGGVELEYRGPDPDQVPLGQDNLIFRAMGEVVGEAASGARLVVRSQIPVGVGLGSSAAALVAGVLIGSELGGGGRSKEELLEVAARLEGHPDNAAAALLGGFVVAAQTSSEVLTRRTELPPQLRFVIATPSVALPTSASRAVLPSSYDREDVTWNLQRAALLTAAFFSDPLGLSPELFSDRLHQGQRAPLVPGIADCLEVRHPDLLGVFLSGAGSSVVGVVRGSEAEVGDLFREAFAGAGISASTRVASGDNLGARVSPIATPE